LRLEEQKERKPRAVILNNFTDIESKMFAENQGSKSDAYMCVDKAGMGRQR
jgi:hypothetical protein